MGVQKKNKHTMMDSTQKETRCDPFNLGPLFSDTPRSDTNELPIHRFMKDRQVNHQDNSI